MPGVGRSCTRVFGVGQRLVMAIEDSDCGEILNYCISQSAWRIWVYENQNRQVNETPRLHTPVEYISMV